jgi:hypothetical protein
VAKRQTAWKRVGLHKKRYIFYWRIR